MGATKLKKVDAELVEKIKSDIEVEINNVAGNLHNRFVAFIAEAKIPLPMVITVLTILLDEAKTEAMRQYFRED